VPCWGSPPTRGLSARFIGSRGSTSLRCRSPRMSTFVRPCALPRRAALNPAPARGDTAAIARSERRAWPPQEVITGSACIPLQTTHLQSKPHLDRGGPPRRNDHGLVRWGGATSGRGVWLRSGRDVRGCVGRRCGVVLPARLPTRPRCGRSRRLACYPPHVRRACRSGLPAGPHLPDRSLLCRTTPCGAASGGRRARGGSPRPA
jgi:hypothetical protein